MVIGVNPEKTFVGTLAQRQYKPGQKYVQLVFKNEQGSQLSLSRNPELVRSLKVGEAYSIVGPEYGTGSKTFIHEPEAQLLADDQTYEQRRSKKPFLIAAGIALPLLLVGSVFAMKLFTNHSVVAKTAPTLPQTDVKGADTEAIPDDTTTATTTDTPTEGNTLVQPPASTTATKPSPVTPTPAATITPPEPPPPADTTTPPAADPPATTDPNTGQTDPTNGGTGTPDPSPTPDPDPTPTQ